MFRGHQELNHAKAHWPAPLPSSSTYAIVVLTIYHTRAVYHPILHTHTLAQYDVSAVIRAREWDFTLVETPKQVSALALSGMLQACDLTIPMT